MARECERRGRRIFVCAVGLNIGKKLGHNARRSFCGLIASLCFFFSDAKFVVLAASSAQNNARANDSRLFIFADSLYTLLWKLLPRWSNATRRAGEFRGQLLLSLSLYSIREKMYTSEIRNPRERFYIRVNCKFISSTAVNFGARGNDHQVFYKVRAYSFILFSTVTKKKTKTL